MVRSLAGVLLLVVAGCADDVAAGGVEESEALDPLDDSEPDTDAEVPPDSEPGETDTDPTPCGVPDASTAPGCLFAVEQPSPGDLITITTSGCWTVRVDHTTITIEDTRGAVMRKVEHWGEMHENLNHKHLKDWEGDRRTVLVPGGVVVTMHAQGVIGLVSVYDGPHARGIDAATNTISTSTDDLGEAAALEAGEADGEAARITELTCEALSYDAEYLQGEDAEGNPLAKEPAPAPIGRTGGAPNPNLVNDFVDDPRLGHT